jgi:hypothetical protein
MNFEEIFEKLKDGYICAVMHPETKKYHYYRILKHQFEGFSDINCTKPLFGSPSFFYAPLFLQNTWEVLKKDPKHEYQRCFYASS